MKLMGFNLTKISGEKKSERPKELKIDRNIQVEDVIQAKSNMFKTKEEILAIKFNYIISYSPDYATMNFSGNILIGVDSKEAKTILKEWENKKLPEAFRLNVFNTILLKSDVRALGLAEDLSLPHHVPLPTLKPQKTENSK